MFQRQKTMWEKALSVLLVFSFALMPVNGYATVLPDGFTGNATITINGKTMDVTADLMDIYNNFDWDSFSIGSDGTVNFVIGTSGVAVNRVTGGSASEIFGTINADGKIFLINTNGILFAPGSSVNAAGLVASSLNMDESDWENNSFSFSCGELCGTVINHGNININQPGGFAALLGSGVLNTGAIIANTGTVALAAGNAMTVNLDPQGLISAVVNITEGTDQNDKGLYAAVNNAGTITANGGRVILTAETLGDIFDSSVNNDGIIEARSLESVDGNVHIRGNQNVELNGTIIASDTIDAYAGKDLIIGEEVNPYTVGSYAWEYLGDGGRAYLFTAFGFYFRDGDTLVYVPLVEGSNMGYDGGATSGDVFYMGSGPEGLFAEFDNIFDNEYYVWHQDPALNADGAEHVNVGEGTYSWEDMFNQGDQDFNDAILSFLETQVREVKGADPLLDAQSIFLTAADGEIIQKSTQMGGSIFAENLMLSAEKGISGVGSNDGIATHVTNVSAVNNEGDIRIENTGDLNISDLSGLTGSNGVSGYNGVFNNGDTISIYAHSNINVNADILNITDEQDAIIELNASEDINVNGKEVKAQTNGDGHAEIHLDAGRNILVDHGKVIADVKGYGGAYVYLNAYDTPDFESLLEEQYTPGDINIIGSLVLAQARGGDDTALVDITGGNVTIDDSEVIANIIESGNAFIFINAEGSRVNNRGGSHPVSYPDPVGSTTVNGYGKVNIVNNSNVLAQNGGEGETANVSVTGGDILINSSDVKANVQGEGNANVLLVANGGTTVTQEPAQLISRPEGSNLSPYYYPGDITYSYDKGIITISGGSNVVAESVGQGGSEAKVCATGGDILVDDSNVTAKVQGDGNAHVGLIASGGSYSRVQSFDYPILNASFDGAPPPLFYDGNTYKYDRGTITISGESNVSAEVGGQGHAEVDLVTGKKLEGCDLSGYCGFDPKKAVDLLGDSCGLSGICGIQNNLFKGLAMPIYLGEVTGGNINIVGGSTVQAKSNGPTSETEGTSLVRIDAANNITIDKTSKASAIATGEGNIAGVLATAGGKIDAQGRVEAIAPDGTGGVAMIATGDVFAGDVETQGSGNIDLVEMAEKMFNVSAMDQYDYSSGTLLASYSGDVILGNITTDILVAVALGIEVPLPPVMGMPVTNRGDYPEYNIGQGSILNAAGDVSANFAYLLAKNDIGVEGNAIDTDVNILAGYSFGEGSIYIDQVTDKTLELGLFLPYFTNPEDRNFPQVKGDLEGENQGMPFMGFLGMSLAAKDGIVHIEGNGDMIVNSIISANGGVYMQSREGSIYAGHGWDPTVSSGLPCGLDSYLMQNPWEDEEESYLSPIMLGAYSEGGPNIIAAGYSYLSTPNGTIGAGTPTSKDPQVSGQVVGYVSPLVQSVNGTQGVSLDKRFGLPPGYVNYQETGNQVWPLIGPGFPGAQTMENPLLVNVDVIGGAHDARPAGYIATGDPSAGLTLQIGSSFPPPGVGAPYLLEDQYIRVYYELTENFRIASMEPVTPTDYYGYHPLLATDSSAFDAIDLDAGAYEYIDGNLNLNNPLNPYFGSEQEEE